MYTLVLASQKGGAGKTTLAGHLAVQAELSGQGPVAMIDTDPQASLTHWWNARKTATPHFAKVDLNALPEALAKLRESGYRLVVFDTPPAVTNAISQVVAHADLVIAPARPSPHDLRAIGDTVDIAERHSKPVVFVINAATPHAKITGEAAVALSQHGTVAPVIVKNRVDFAASMVDGRTVGEVTPDSPSAVEIRDLWIYIQARLSRIMHDPRMRPDFRANHLSISPLSPLDEAVTDEPEEREDRTEAGQQDAPSPTQQPDVADLRMGTRDERMPPRRFVSVARRRSSFGRRALDY